MLQKQIKIFIFLGLTATFINFGVYICLVTFGIVTAVAKLIGFVTGMIVSYYGNKYLTFNYQGRFISSTSKFALLYSFSATADVATNEWMLNILEFVPYQKTLAFVVATGISAFINFVGMKFVVFSSNK